MNRATRIDRCCALVAGVFTMSAVIATSASAQRFEGIITMRLSGLQGLQGMATQMAERAARGGSEAGPGTPCCSGAARVRPDSAAAGRGSRAVPPSAARGPAPGRNAPPEAVRSAVEARGTAIPSELEYMTRRGKVRIAVGAGKGAPALGAMIYSPDEGVVYTLIPAASMYMESPIPSEIPAPPSEPTTRRQAQLQAPVVTHTKKFELIAGHRCEHVEVSVNKQMTDICMAKGLGAFVMPSGVGRNEAWQRVLSEANGFPLKVVQPDGKTFMEVVKVERKALPEALFTVPETYSKMSDRLGRPPG